MTRHTRSDKKAGYAFEEVGSHLTGITCTSAENRIGAQMGAYSSIIDNAGVPGQQFFCLLVEFTGDFMDVILGLAAGTAHTNPTAHAVHFELC